MSRACEKRKTRRMIFSRASFCLTGELWLYGEINKCSGVFSLEYVARGKDVKLLDILWQWRDCRVEKKD